MILEELYLQNFCLYKGLHRFALAPQTAEGALRPITLFGGMNGAGKTTILDAVQLALYGSRARTASRLGKSYEDYLRECIHRGSSANDGASVSIKFRYHSEGQHHTYEVWRGWSLREKLVRERVRVTKDDVPDTFLSEHWNDVVEELIPIGVSQLFFFDAEKIRFLADDDTDTVALGAAIKSLLGLDLAERLIADAAVVEKRLSDTVLSRSADERITKLQHDLEAKSAELTTAKADRAALENPLLRARKALEKAKGEFAAAGGEHWTRRTELQAELQAAETAIRAIESDLRDQCAADLPLLLIPDLVTSVKTRDLEEQQIATARSFQESLKVRDRKILKEAKAAKLGERSLETLRTLLEADRKDRLTRQPETMLLDLSGHTRSTLLRLTGGGFDDQRRQLRKVLAKLKSLHAKKEKTLRLLNAAPADESVAGLVERLGKCAANVGTLEGDAKRLDDRIDVLRRERDELDHTLSSVRQTMVAQAIEHDDAIRMAKLAQRTQTTMRDFLHRATAHKIERLSDLVTRSFQFLLRKRSLVAKVQIHPESFKIDLFDDAGKAIPKSRLSEGEKQIFAIAVLWGLAQASPRQLPSIIDTPMARLDSAHRQHLVERYFPNASHQVIVLSTDTEVERDYFEQLRPRLARSYHLSYDDTDRSTRVEDGYFWQAGAEAEATT
jgi:DNA sulfur modification protein DndD